MKSVVDTTGLRGRADHTDGSWSAAARADLGGAAGWRLVVLVPVLFWIVFQWGFGNDAVLPWVVALAFDAIDDRETWRSGVAAAGAAGLVGMAFWTITQAVDALVVLSGTSLIPRLTNRLSQVLRSKGWVTPYADMKWSTRWIIAYATGASAVCLVDVFATGRRGVAGRVRMVIEAVLLSSVTVGLVVTAVAFAAVLAVRVPATADEAEVFIRFARNPLTWLALFATLFGVSALRSRLAGDEN